MNIDLSKYKKLCKKAGIADGKLNDRFMFTLFVADLYYFENEIKISDIQDGFVDGSGDGGMDFITIYDDELKIIQGKSSKKIDFQMVINIVNQIIETIEAINNINHNNLNNQLVSKFLNARDSLQEDSDIEIIIVTAGNINKKLRQRINEKLKEKKYSNYHYKIVDIEDLGNKNFELITQNEYVQHGALTLTETNRFLKFENSFLTNIKASSLKELYHKSRSSLFNYNLREFIPNKQVDSGIDKTIEKEKEKFWYFNNGITIICSNCKFDGDNVKIDNFQ